MMLLSNYFRWILATVFLAAIFAISAFTLEKLEEETKRNTVRALETVVKTTHETLQIWMDDFLAETMLFSEEPEFAAFMSHLQTGGYGRDTVLDGELAAGVESLSSRFFGLGHFSSVHILSRKGEAVFSLAAEPLEAGRGLSSEGAAAIAKTLEDKRHYYTHGLFKESLAEKKSLSSIFLLLPYLEGEEDGGAFVLAFGFGIIGNLSRIAHTGRIGDSGETYVFDKRGVMLTNSRFSEGLKAIGLLRQEQASALNIEIRDPGARLRKGVAPALPFSQSPLTFMAGKAVAGNSGSSLAPYRDYRGIEVLGSWIWDDNLHIGMATEIDLNEALEPYHHARKRMVMVVGMIVFLALLFEAVLAFANRRYSRELEERSRILAQSQRISGAGSWVWTPVTGEMWLSVECYHLLELSPEEFTPSPEAFSSLFSGWSGEPLRELLDKLAASGGAMELETLYEGKDGAVRHFSIQGETRHPEDDPRHMVIGSVLDITERKEKEKALKLHQDHLEELLQQRAGDLVRMNQELKEFAYVASHDLKSPLRSAASLAGWLAEDYSDKLDKEGIDYIDQLLAQIDYMNKLIEGVLEYSSVDKSARRIAKLDSGKAASMVIDRMDKGDNTQITIEGQMPDVLYDDIQFTQTLQNLLDNAVKHMDKPDGKVAISCKDAGESWEFCVSDNGPGIEKEHYERIFRIFQRLKKGKSIDNTGIGLALVKKIVQSNGGKVWLESAPGEGSRFYFSVPKKPVSPHEYSQDNVI